MLTLRQLSALSVPSTISKKIGTISMREIISSYISLIPKNKITGNTSTVTASTGAGTSPTVAITGNRDAGTISLTVGSSTAQNATILSVFLGTATGYVTILTPTSDKAIANNSLYRLVNTNNGFDIVTRTASSTALTTGDVYTWNYVSYLV